MTAGLHFMYVKHLDAFEINLKRAMLLRGRSLFVNQYTCLHTDGLCIQLSCHEHFLEVNTHINLSRKTLLFGAFGVFSSRYEILLYECTA